MAAWNNQRSTWWHVVQILALPQDALYMNYAVFNFSFIFANETRKTQFIANVSATRPSYRYVRLWSCPSNQPHFLHLNDSFMACKLVFYSFNLYPCHF